MKTWQRILIVAVLLSIGVAVGFTKLAQSQRNNMVSVSNLKMIGLAWMMYADDNNQNLVRNAGDGQAPPTGFYAPNLCWVVGNVSSAANEYTAGIEDITNTDGEHDSDYGAVVDKVNALAREALFGKDQPHA